MTDKEKVIRGLACWAEDTDYDVYNCADCSYNVPFKDTSCCDVKQILKDALNVMREVRKMPDKEKVIKRLEECLSASCRGFRTCPYSDDEWDAVESAIALLKEQEPVKPREQEENRIWTVCGNCSQHLISKWLWCPNCGKKVKWEWD